MKKRTILLSLFLLPSLALAEGNQDLNRNLVNGAGTLSRGGKAFSFDLGIDCLHA